ncbi:hypothetical protein QFC21_004466 [Naganishia friedmannii]|uniref:Uncharacterized protein n=1 Tax=Naganishia friedmannii TaxID=89922 RepID=A0ACC2VFP4_9TREE|nr:hypothetical protein QFC21_004466 [Naganishia friedmannii]
MTPSQNPPSSSQDSPPLSADSDFGVQSMQSSIISDHREKRDSEGPSIVVPVPNDGDQSVILRDALRMAMTMSSEGIAKEDITSRQQGTQARLSQSSQSPQIVHATDGIQRHSRSNSFSAESATPLSLSLSTPASPVSLSSVPASMALSMDLDSDTDMDMETDMDTSTTWSLYGSSGEDSRAGSPASRPRHAAGGPSSGVPEGVATAGARLQSQTGSQEAASSRIGRGPSTFPYPISRRNTATIPSLIRRNTSTQTRSKDDNSTSGPRSFESATRTTTTTTAFGNDTHSRSHWAVQESLDRQRYQGDLFDLVLPVLELPGASVSTTMADSRHRPEKEVKASQTRTPPKTEDCGANSSSVLSMVLCGTNRTTNTFLRDLMRDSRFEVYKFPSSSTRVAPPPQGQDVRGAYYTASVYVVDPPRQGVSHRAIEGKKPVARIKVFGKGQHSNLDNAISYIKHTYTRLDSLLRPPLKEEDPGSLGSSDMYGLVESWVWGPAASGSRNEDVQEADWCELAVLTGDGRHLLGKERSQMEELIAMVPTICYPEDLSSLLSLACGLDFYTPDVQLSSTRPSLRRRTESDVGQVADLLLCIAYEGSEATVDAHRQLRKSGIRSFLQWRSLNLQRSYNESTILGTSRGAASTSLQSPSDSRNLAANHDQNVQEPLPIEQRPIPTLARARGSYEGQPGNWEAGLSRRVAARRDADKERLATSKRKKLPADASTLGTGGSTEKPSTQDRSGFFDDRCVGEGYAASARSGGLGMVKGLRAGWDILKAFVYPLSLMQGVIRPETTGGMKGFGGWGMLKVACVGLIVGLAGLWLSRF